MVTDEEILDAYQALAREEGLFVEPASAAGVAGLLKLANEGLPKSADTGLEFLESDQELGASQFVQQARYQHALEGELSRTIGTIRRPMDLPSESRIGPG